MPFRKRQTKFYIDRCLIYRKNLVKAANGEFTYSLVTQDSAVLDATSRVICKHFTSRNMNQRDDVVMSLQDDVFTADKLHLGLETDIQAEDIVKMVVSPNSAGSAWFRVGGGPQSRGGISNRTEVYLKPRKRLAASVIV